MRELLFREKPVVEAHGLHGPLRRVGGRRRPASDEPCRRVGYEVLGSDKPGVRDIVLACGNPAVGDVVFGFRIGRPRDESRLGIVAKSGKIGDSVQPVEPGHGIPGATGRGIATVAEDFIRSLVVDTAGAGRAGGRNQDVLFHGVAPPIGTLAIHQDFEGVLRPEGELFRRRKHGVEIEAEALVLPMAGAVGVAGEGRVAAVAGKVLPDGGGSVVDADTGVVDAVEAERKVLRQVSRVERTGGRFPLPGDFDLVGGRDGDGEDAVTGFRRAPVAGSVVPRGDGATGERVGDAANGGAGRGPESVAIFVNGECADALRPGRALERCCNDRVRFRYAGDEAILVELPVGGDLRLGKRVRVDANGVVCAFAGVVVSLPVATDVPPACRERLAGRPSCLGIGNCCT